MLMAFALQIAGGCCLPCVQRERLGERISEQALISESVCVIHIVLVPDREAGASQRYAR
jgi:hypothetical protein